MTVRVPKAKESVTKISELLETTSYFPEPDDLDGDGLPPDPEPDDGWEEEADEDVRVVGDSDQQVRVAGMKSSTANSKESISDTVQRAAKHGRR